MSVSVSETDVTNRCWAIILKPDWILFAVLQLHSCSSKLIVIKFIINIPGPQSAGSAQSGFIGKCIICCFADEEEISHILNLELTNLTPQKLCYLMDGNHSISRLPGVLSIISPLAWIWHHHVCDKVCWNKICQIVGSPRLEILILKSLWIWTYSSSLLCVNNDVRLSSLYSLGEPIRSQHPCHVITLDQWCAT